MRILLSGQAAAAVTLDPPHRLYRLDEPSSDLGANFNHGLRYFDGCSDVRELNLGGHEAINARIETEWAIDRSLTLFLLTLDEKRDASQTNEMNACLEELLSQEPNARAVRCRLCASPLPVLVEVTRVRSSASDFPSTVSLVDWFFQSQPTIKILHDSFEFSRAESATSSEDASKLYMDLALDGVLLSLVEKLDSNQDLSFERIKHSHDYPRYRSLISSWLSSVTSRTGNNAVHVKNINLLEESEDDPDWDRSGQGTDGRKIYERVRKQQFAIIELLRSRDIEAARSAAQQLVADQKANSSDEQIGKTLCFLSKEAKEHGIFELQLEWAKEATRQSSADPKTFGHLADAFIAIRDYPSALKAVEDIAACGGIVFAEGRKGRILRETGRLSEARDLYLAAYQEHQGHPEAPYLIASAADTLKEMGRVHDSLEEYQGLTNKYPLEHFIWTGYGMALLAAGRSSDALRIFSTSLTHKTTDAALIGRASAYRQAGNFSEAQSIYNKVLERYPFNEQALCGLADMLLSRGRPADAFDAYDRASEVVPESPLPLCGKAKAQFQLARYGDALKTYAETLKRFKNDAEAARGLIYTLIRMGKIPEAMRNADYFASELPFSLEIRALRAQILSSQGKNEAAVAQVTQNLEKNAKHAASIRISAIISMNMGNYSKALDALPTQTPTSRHDWRLWVLRCIALSKVGHGEVAAKDLKNALNKCAFFQERKAIRSALALVQLERKKFAQARAIVSETPDEVENVIAFRVLASTHMVKQARQILDNIHQIEPNGNVINFMLEVARRTKLVQGGPRQNERWFADMQQRIMLARVA